MAWGWHPVTCYRKTIYQRRLLYRETYLRTESIAAAAARSCEVGPMLKSESHSRWKSGDFLD